MLGLRRRAALVLLVGACLASVVPACDRSHRGSNRLPETTSGSRPLVRVVDVIQEVRLIVYVLLQHFIGPVQRLVRLLSLLLQLPQLQFLGFNLQLISMQCLLSLS